MALDKRNLYRMPWSMNDNAIAWLELTDICNLYCEGCYRQKITGHKPLEQVKEELRFFKKWRNPDNVSIAGGEPLIYPNIMEVVSYVAELKMKPVVLTNAMALTPEMLKELKKAKLSGFTVHIDSHQVRPHWKGKTEKELNELRQHYADMIAAEGGLYVVFNSTVYPSSYREIPDVVRWGRDNIDKVHGLVFITYRTGTSDTSVAVSSDSKVVDLSKLSYVRDHFEEKFVTSPEVYQIIQDNNPEYDAACYLGGTLKVDSYKWLASAWVGSRKRMFGSVGKRTMELAQAGHHAFKGTYLAYLSDSNVGAKVFLLSLIDPAVRKLTGAWFKHVVKNPKELFETLHVQSIGIIQAPDILPDGRADMCDSCPDMTVWDGKLVNSCRMDEYRLFGGMVSVLDKAKVAQEAAPEAAPSQN